MSTPDERIKAARKAWRTSPSISIPLINAAADLFVVVDELDLCKGLLCVDCRPSEAIVRLIDERDALRGEAKEQWRAGFNTCSLLRDALERNTKSNSPWLEIVRLKERIAELERENFALAAGACVHPTGVVGDEGGTPRCPLEYDGGGDSSK